MSIAYLPWARADVADQPCLRDEAVQLTYAQVARRVDAAAEQFAARGVGLRDLVTIMLPNRLELLIALMAAWRLSAAATPINPVFTPNEACYQIADSQASLLVTTDPTPDLGISSIPVDDLATDPTGPLRTAGPSLHDLA